MSVQLTKFAILVTCYNQAHRITKTLDSLKNQTLSDDKYHIYVSDDLSTDNSLAVLKEYQKTYPFTILQPDCKKYVGKNRNTLIQHAQGEFCVFVDGDDPQELNFLETLDRQITGDFDIYYLSNFTEVWADDKLVEKNALNYDNFMFKVYKTSVLQSMHVNEAIKIGEDVEFAFRYYELLHHNISVINANYLLNRRDDNISLTKNSDVQQRYELELQLYELIKQYEVNDELITKINNKKVELIQLAVLLHQTPPQFNVVTDKLSMKFKLSYYIYKFCNRLNLIGLYYKLLDYKIGHKI